MGFIDFFAGLRTAKDLFRFFERKSEGLSGNYYTCHGQNASEVAAKFYKTQSVVKRLGGSGSSSLASVSLSPKMLATAVRELLVESMNVEIFEGSGEKWKVQKRASPGNLREIEDLIATDGGDNSTNATVVAVTVTQRSMQRKIGVACINTTFCGISLFEFTDDVGMKQLEGLMLQVGASECLVKESDNVTGVDDEEGALDVAGGDLKTLQSMLRRCHVKITHQPASSFSTRTVEDDLEFLLPPGSQNPLQLSEVGALKSALASLAACIDFLKLQGDTAQQHRYQLLGCRLPSCMRYDSATAAALQLLPPGGVACSSAASAVRRSRSVYDLLNHCKTAMGSRVLMRWVRQPLVDAERIRQRLDLVEMLVGPEQLLSSSGSSSSSSGDGTDTGTGTGSFSDYGGHADGPDASATMLRTMLGEALLPRLPDIERLSHALMRGRASLPDLLRLYQCLLVLPRLAKVLQDHVRACGGESGDKSGGGSSNGDGGRALSTPVASATPAIAFRDRFVAPIRHAESELKMFGALVEQAIDLQEYAEGGGGGGGGDGEGEDAVGEGTAGRSFAIGRFAGRLVKIRPRFHESLAVLHRGLVTAKREAAVQLGTVASLLGIKTEQLKLEQNSQHGMHLRITKKLQPKLKQAMGKAGGKAKSKGKSKSKASGSGSGSSSGSGSGSGSSSGSDGGGASSFTILSIQKAGVLFTTPTLRAISRRHDSLTERYRSAQAQLEAKVLSVARSYCHVFDGLSASVAELDCIASLAHSSVSSPTLPYVRPAVTAMGKGDLMLEQARHPLVELMEHQRSSSSSSSSNSSSSSSSNSNSSGARILPQVPQQYIPNDVCMVRNRSRLQIVTGPNMGGKSTYIRKVGVLSLMAQVGSFLPCSQATLPVVDAIYARVGASDAQQLGVSTFMVEMLQTSSILRNATKDSLIVIDELGRGTSTYDGFGLAWAIGSFIARDLRALCLFATHFHELTQLAEEDGACAKNMHMTAHTSSSSLTMLYSVQPGPCARSFGIHVAKLARFPASIVAEATRVAAKLETGWDGMSHALPSSGDARSESEPACKRRRILADTDQGSDGNGGGLPLAEALLQAQTLATTAGDKPLDQMSAAEKSSMLTKVKELQRRIAN